MTTTKFKFSQLENESNFFEISLDINKTTVNDFKSKIFEFFKKLLKEELNMHINSCEFYKDNNSNLFFDNNTQTLKTYFSNNDYSFYFLLQEQKINFYKNKPNLQLLFPELYEEINEEEDNNNNNNNNIIEIRKNIPNGKTFKVIIQTYAHLIKEIQVYPEMTIGELKEEIERVFKVRKEYQELLYLVYRLNDDNKLVKDYYIRPNGIIFLRGFYFPLLFVDFYQRKNKNLIAVNIAEKVECVKNEILNKLNLQQNFDLIFNGKVLNDDSYLIDYYVQKMQIIYFR
jgi:hypothetical protein